MDRTKKNDTAPTPGFPLLPLVSRRRMDRLLGVSLAGVAIPASTGKIERPRSGSRLCSARRSPCEGRGEVALMQAVLNDAVHCFRAYCWLAPRYRPRIAREATTWLFADDEQWPFSCVNICTVLGVEPAYLRRTLIREQARALLTVTANHHAGVSSDEPPEAA